MVRPNRQMQSTSVYLTLAQAAELHELQERTGVPTARRIRDGVDLILARERAGVDAPWPPKDAPVLPPKVVEKPALKTPNVVIAEPAPPRNGLSPPTGAFYAPRKP